MMPSVGTWLMPHPFVETAEKGLHASAETQRAADQAAAATEERNLPEVSALDCEHARIQDNEHRTPATVPGASDAPAAPAAAPAAARAAASAAAPAAAPAA